MASYFSSDDYPREALRAHEQGMAAFDIDIDASGRVSACRVTRSSGSAALDEATCQIAQQRARFSPARDQAGRPVPDHISQRILWLLPGLTSTRAWGAPPASYISFTDYPGEALRRGEQGRVGFELGISPQGRVSNCRVIASSGSLALDRATCTIMRRRARFTPARDDQGNPIADTYQGSIEWILQG